MTPIDDPCEECEEMMQPFLDGSLSEEEVARAQKHLETCSWCAKRYKFEERLRHYVRVAVSVSPGYGAGTPLTAPTARPRWRRDSSTLPETEWVPHQGLRAWR